VVGPSAKDTKLVGSLAKEHTMVAASSSVDDRPTGVSSPCKRQSPAADVSGANEEWETASEGSDGGLHPRRPMMAAHRDDHGVKYNRVSGDVVSRSSVEEPKDSFSGGSRGIAVHSPCTSGVPSLAVTHADFGYCWKEVYTFTLLLSV